jgi:hypothetical protein
MFLRNELCSNNLYDFILNTRFFGNDDRIRNFSNTDIEVTLFPIGNGRGLSVNHRRPDVRARSVFVVHSRRGEPAQTLLFISGEWEESIKQLAAEAKPRKLEADGEKNRSLCCPCAALYVLDPIIRSPSFWSFQPFHAFRLFAG